MRTFSASEAISPAINRTKAILFQPFRKGRTWKLAATAYLCRFGTMFLPFPFVYLVFLPAAKNAGIPAVAILCGVIALLTAIALPFFYLCSKLQFAFFDIVLNRNEFVAPAWRKYGRQSLTWTAAKIAMGVAVTTVAAVPIAAYLHHILPLLRVMQTLKPGQPPPPQFIAGIFAGYGILLLIFGPFFLISSLMSDFIVPSLALEDTSLTVAFRRMFDLIRREPGEFAIYVLLKLGLSFALYMGAILAWEIVFIFSTLIAGLIIGGLGYLLHLAGVSMILLMIFGGIIAVVWYGFILVYAMLLTIGGVLTFMDAYALYFLGGRYPLLGELLERSEPIPVAYAPPLPSYPPSYPPPPPLAG